MTAVIVCGGRNGQPHGVTWRGMDAFTRDVLAVSHVIVGSFRGTDQEAFLWAMARELDGSILNARWKTGERKGPAEGPMRNRRMPKFAVTPRAVLTFPGGSGTRDMCSVARVVGLPLWGYAVRESGEWAWKLEVA